jgi:prophage regulatory protein
MKLLSLPELKSVKGIRFDRTWIYRLVAAGRFPAPVKIGEATNAWIESEIDAWLAARVAERDSSRTKAA